MKKHKIFLLIACLAANACSRSAESTTATEQIQLVEAVTRLHANPWAGWLVGTRVITHFAKSTPQYPGVKHYAQPDLTYEVAGAMALI